MIITVKIECDNCLKSFEFSVEREGALSAWKDIQCTDMRDIMADNNWHFLYNCLCPECKTKVGEDNCMNCIHIQHSGSNSRCTGFASYNKPLVSMFDTCTYFERNV